MHPVRRELATTAAATSQARVRAGREIVERI
jgi:hypothetical protein